MFSSRSKRLIQLAAWIWVCFFGFAIADFVFFGQLIAQIDGVMRKNTFPLLFLLDGIFCVVLSLTLWLYLAKLHRRSQSFLILDGHDDRKLTHEFLEVMGFVKCFWCWVSFLFVVLEFLGFWKLSEIMFEDSSKTLLFFLMVLKPVFSIPFEWCVLPVNYEVRQEEDEPVR